MEKGNDNDFYGESVDEKSESKIDEIVNSADSPRLVTKKMRDILKSDFPDEAYSTHDSKKYLTTLKAIYIVERLNDVFGLGRWNLNSEVIKTEKPMIKCGPNGPIIGSNGDYVYNSGYVMVKGLLDIFDFDIIIPIQYGGHELNHNELADGYKSAITDVLSKSASYLEIGLKMFKGLIDPPSANAKSLKSNFSQKPPEKSTQSGGVNNDAPPLEWKDEQSDFNHNGDQNNDQQSFNSNMLYQGDK